MALIALIILVAAIAGAVIGFKEGGFKAAAGGAMLLATMAAFFIFRLLLAFLPIILVIWLLVSIFK